MDEPERVGSLAESFDREWRELLDEVGVDLAPTELDQHGRQGLDLSDPHTAQRLIGLFATYVNSLSYEVDKLRTQLEKLEGKRGGSGREQ